MTEDPVMVTPVTEDPNFVPAVILRNKGVPVTLHRMTDGQVEMDGDEALTRLLHLRFNANAVADIEDHWDGIEVEVPVYEEIPVLVDGKPLQGPSGPVLGKKETGTEVRRFYGIQGFQKAMEIRPNKTVRDAMAIGLGMTPEEMGVAMISTEFLAYQNAVGVAWSMAQGVDPTEAAKVLHRITVAVAAQSASLASELNRTMDEAEGLTTVSPGSTGSGPGSPLDALSMSSGA